MADFKIIIRQSTGDQFEIEVNNGNTVTEVKAKCEEKTGMKAEEMRMIFKGKILKDDMTVEDYKITDGLTVHLVKGKSAAGSS